MISVLFTRKNSVYNSLGVDCWDAERDARNWAGTGPIIAHPPCRAWGRFAWKSKHDDYEKSHAPWAMDQVRKHGGILEHPVTSRLWDLLQPGDQTIVVDQHWWGHRAQKRTRLFFAGPVTFPVMPLSLDAYVPVEFMCQAERERTPPDFAKWLVLSLGGS